MRSKTFIDVMKRSVQTILVLALLLLPQVVWAGSFKEIAPQRVYDLLKEGSGLWLIDVRSPVAFAAGHIEGSVNIPAAELTTKHFPRQKILVLTDHSLGELQAKDAATLLSQKGKEQLFVLTGGLSGWQRAGLPVAGEGENAGSLRVMPQELARALEAKLPLRLIDLRADEERGQGAVAGAQVLSGGDLEEKLAQIRRTLEQEERETKKNLAQKLRPVSPTVLLFPVKVTDPAALLARHLRGLAADIRYVEGGYLATTPRQKLTISNVEGCPTCPGDMKQGESK